MLYVSASSSNEPSLYICRVSNVLGRVPLMPCFVAGNKHPTLPRTARSIGSRQARSQTPVKMLATAANCLWSALGCGATGGGSQEWYQSVKQRLGGKSECLRPGGRGVKPSRGAGLSAGMISMSASAAAGQGMRMSSEIWCYRTL